MHSKYLGLAKLLISILGLVSLDSWEIVKPFLLIFIYDTFYMGHGRILILILERKKRKNGIRRNIILIFCVDPKITNGRGRKLGDRPDWLLLFA